MDEELLRTYVLAEDREAVVRNQVKGTQSYFLLNILHDLNTGRHHDAEVLLHEWEKSTRKLPKDHALLKNRCMAALYDKKPDLALKHFERQFNIKLQHPAPPSATTTQKDLGESVATTLDPRKIDLDELATKLMPQDPGLGMFSDAALPWLSDHWRKLTTNQLSALLHRIQFPTHKDIVAMLVADCTHGLKTGDLRLPPVLFQLPIPQLDELAASCPALLQNREFVGAYLQKLGASPATRLHTDLARLERYLNAAIDFTTKLTPAFNGLRAAALYHKLNYLITHFELYDVDLFMEYLSIPKRAPLAKPVSKEAQKTAFQVARTRLRLPGSELPTVSDDSPFIRDFLEYIFKTESITSTSPFDKHLDKATVKHIFAKAKLSSGAQDTEHYVNMLKGAVDVATYQKEKRLQFTKQNKEHYAIGEPVMLSVELKNIQQLDIQVFEVNTFNYYKDKKEPVPSTLNIDGLLPSLKATRSYDEFPSIAIHRHELELKELDHRGVFLVELRGAGLSSRAMVCIGQLYATTAPGVAGTEVRVYNELGQHLPHATVWMEGREYGPSDPGDDFVTLPFSSSDRSASVVLHADGFFSLATVPLLHESYRLSCRCLVNTEAFVRGNLQARVVVLPSLLLASSSVRVSPTLMSQPSVTTVLMDRQREVLTQTDHSIAFSDGTDPELVVKVPPGAATLHVTVRGTVKHLDGTKQTVSHTTHHDIHAAASVGSRHNASNIPPTSLHASIDSVYLVCSEGSEGSESSESSSSKETKDVSSTRARHAQGADATYALHVRGRCGEVRQGVRVEVTLQHEYVDQPIVAELQTDSNGVAHLGPLPFIASVDAELGTGQSSSWMLSPGQRCAPLPSSLTVVEGEPYTLPYTGPQHAVHVFSTDQRLAATTRNASGPTVLENHTSSALQFSARSFTFTAPGPGTYTLVLEWQSDDPDPDQHITITALPRNAGEACRGRLTPPEGTQHPGTYTASPHTVGGTPSPALVHVRGIAVDAVTGEVRVGLGNARPESTRVHVFSRWSCVSLDALLDGDDDEPSPFEGQLHTPAEAHPPTCRYLSGRVLSDEHRYVLRRRGLPPRLGNMLDKPQLVLNPTELRETTTRHEALERERAWDTGANQPQCMQAQAARRKLRNAGRYQHSLRVGGVDDGRLPVPSYDWLETPACVVANARPSPEDPGSVTIALPPKALAGAARVFVVVVDEEQLLLDSAPVAHAQQRAPNARDVRHRWPHALDTPYAEERQVVPLQAGAAWCQTSHSGDVGTAGAGGRGGGMDGQEGEAGAEAAVFDTVDTVEKLLSGLMSLLPSEQAAQLGRFSFLAKWPRLSTEAKVELYQEHCCHELNLLLFNKDPVFFQDVVRPFLASKLDKDVVDRCLLYPDLGPHLPALRSRMGDDCPVVEKLLLAWRGVLSAGELAAFLQATTKEQRNSPRVTALFDRLITAKQQQQAEASEEPMSEMSMEADEEEAEGEEGMMAPQAMNFSVMDADFLQAAPMQRAAAPAPGGGGARMKRGGLQKKRRRAAPKLAKPVGKTKEYAEKTYWEHNPEQRLRLRVSPFWADCALALAEQMAGAGGTTPRRPACMVPTWLHAAGTTVNEALLVLALIDLPFDNTMHVDDAQRITHTNNSFVLTSALRPLTEKDEGKTMVFQTFFDPLGAADSPAPTEFQTGRVYGQRIICTNMTNSSLQADLLRQVPDGAIPLPNVSGKKSEHVQLSSFGIHRTELFFYFPYAGEFRGYPACLSKDNKLLCMASPSIAKAVDVLSTYDTTSWSSVAAHGTNDEVLAFLHEHPESRTEARRVLWRCRSKEFFLKLVDVLRKTGAFNKQVWGYAIKHHDEKSLGELLASRQKDFGPGLKTNLLVTPWNLNYKHTDFWPVVNARAHSITEEKTQVLNDAILSKKRLLFRDLSFNPTLPPEALPILCYFMILEDDIDGAKAMLQRACAQREGDVCSLQLDYLQCYLDFYQGPQLHVAREIVAKRAKMSLPRWNTKFSEIAAMISEIDSGTPAASDTKSTSAVPAMDISLQGHDVAISYSGMGEAGAEATVNFYVMDIELLFSSQPFAQSGKPTFTYVLPNLSNKVPLSSSEGQVVHTLPDVAQKRDGLVEVVCRGISRTANYFASRLRAQILETHGHVRVMDMQGRPLPASYVKVYARKEDDSVSFFKDGYTDLRGKFDYFSVNTEEKDVQELSILVSHKDHGAIIQTAKPPSH